MSETEFWAVKRVKYGPRVFWDVLQPKPDGEFIARCLTEDTADLIVRAHKSHDKLLAACERLFNMFLLQNYIHLRRSPKCKCGICELAQIAAAAVAEAEKE